MSEKYPILLVSGDFVKTGGMDRANFALADYLARAGRELHLVAHRVDPSILAHTNVTFHRVPKPANAYMLGAPLLDRIGRHWAKKIQARGGRVVTNGGNCPVNDINWVHYVHAAYRPQTAGPLSRRMLGAWKHRGFLKDERRALRAAKLVIANSERTRADLVDHVGIATQKIRTIYYGTDAASFQPAEVSERLALRARLGWAVDVPFAVFVGALGDRRKGFDTLFDAWRRLCGAGTWDAQLAVVGAGAELAAWKDRAQAAGLGNSIHFLGFRRDVPDVLRSSDLIVAPTRYEAYGLGVHEALCCGVPALVSRDSGVAEQCPAELKDKLLLPDANDPIGLVDRLRAWRNDVKGYRCAVDPLSQILRGRTWDTMAKEIVGLISE